MTQGFHPYFFSTEQDVVLQQIVELAAPGRVGVFDLDSCLFDPRYRQLPILREYASRHAKHELYKVAVEHFVNWDLRTTLLNAGLKSASFEVYYDDLLAFWYERFFYSPYVGFDHAMPGAVTLVRECAQKGMSIAYLTGRNHENREATIAAFHRFGFPYDGVKHCLFTKEKISDDDTLFKKKALQDIGKLGEICLFMDNEPSNINAFADECPQAYVVFVQTDHSFLPVKAYEQLPRVRSFWRSAWGPL